MSRRRLNSTIAVKTARRKIGGVHQLLRLASAGAVLTLIFTGLAVLGSLPAAQAGPVKPTVSSFAVTPSALNFQGWVGHPVSTGDRCHELFVHVQQTGHNRIIGHGPLFERLCF